MAALDFPASPLLNDIYTANGRSWKWNGVVWVPQSQTFTNDGSFVYYDGPLNVGIGTTTPSTKLEVAGTITATAFAGPLTGNVTGQVTDISNHSTTDLSEGTNLYWTQARFDTAIGVASTTDLSEGTNLYFTNERVDDRVNALFVAGANITLTYNDVANTFTVASTAAGATIITQDEGILLNASATTLNFVGAGVTAADVGGVTTVTVSQGAISTLNDIGNVAITTNSTGELLKWSGTAWINNTLAEAGISATGHTHVAVDITDFDVEVANNTAVAANTAKVSNVTADLSTTHNASTVVIHSSDGSDAIINAATATTAGIMSEAIFDQHVLNNAKISDINHNVTTNLGYNTAASTGTVTSSDGTNATIPAATISLAGLLTGADKTKLNAIETGATADQTAGEIEAIVTHDNLIGFVGNEHIDWTTDQGATNIHSGNYINTTYSVGDGGLTQINFTSADNTKLDGIEALADVTDATNVNAAGAVMNSDTSTAAMSFVIDEDTFTTNSATKVPTQQSVKAYVDGAVASNVTYEGGYNASTNTPNLDTSPSGITTGNMYTVTVAGTFFATDLEVGDVLIAEQDNPTLESHWTVVNKDLNAASIKTSYESNADTNAFTNTLLSKLNAIEANATADQTAGEIEAIVTHDNLIGFVTNEHIDWTTDQGATNIHVNNLTGIALTGHTHVAANITDFTIASNLTIDARVNKAFVDALNVDADTIDSLNSTSFLRSDANDSLNDTIVLTIDGKVDINNFDGGLRFTEFGAASGTTGAAYIHGVGGGGDNILAINRQGSSNYTLHINGTQRVFADNYHPNADTWTTGRTITLTGDVTGTSAAWDGSGNISFATTVANNSHTHIAANITDFDTEVSNNVSVAANTAKVSNVTTNLGYNTAATTGTVTSSDGTNATIPAATGSLAGLLTGADKSKLDGIATGANNYTHPSDGTDLGAALTGANVISDVNVNAAGHVTGFATRALTATDISAAESTDTVFGKNAMSTGLKTGGIITIDVDTTKFDISAGTGYVIDNTTDPANPVTTLVSWSAFNAQTPTNILTQPVTYISISSAGAIVQESNIPNAEDRRTNIFLGVVVHADNVIVNIINNLPVVAFDVGGQIQDLMNSFGFRSLNGNLITANGINMSLDKSSGTGFKAGINFHTNPKQPHEVLLGSQTLLSFNYRNQDSSQGLQVTVIDPTTYDLAGVTTTVPTNNNATIQRVYMFPSGAIFIQRGQEVFATLGAALDAVGRESFVVETNIAENALLLASVVVKKTATDLTDVGEASVIPVSTTTTGSIGFTTTLQQSYDISPTPEIITNSTSGALTIQRGSAADTDNVLEIKNGAGTNVVDLTGQGNMTLAGDLTVSGNNIFMPPTNARVKYGVWDSTQYGIGMGNIYTLGGLNNYAMTFQMSNIAERGFWWGDDTHTNAQGAMSLTTNGKLAVAHSMRLGYGESDTTTPGATYRLDVNGDTNITGDLTVDTNTLHVDAANGRVGIGVITPLYKQHTEVSGVTGNIAGFGLTGNANNPLLLIQADSSNQTLTFRGGSNSGTYPAIAFDMGTSGEAMRITNTGRLLVGVTTEQGSTENANEGISLYPTGAQVNARTSASANLYLNKIGAVNGEYIRFVRNGVDIGSIDSTGTNITFSGNASTATVWETSRTITLTGDVTGTSAAWDGSGNISFATTIAPNSLVLGTATTGNYVATITGTANEVEVTGSGSETAAVTIGLPNTVLVTTLLDTPLLKADELRCKTAQQLVINAGESASYATGQTNENVYINAENGLEINSSPDNWASLWAGRQTAFINDSSGNSSFPGNVTATSLSLTGTIDFNDVSQYWLKTATNWGIYWDTTANTIEFHGAGTDRWSVDLDNGNQSMAGDLTVSGNQIFTAGTDARVKYGVWNDSQFGTGMGSSYTFGGIDNDYAMTFQMSNDNTRGFWWGDTTHTNAQGAMALTSNGKLTVAQSLRLGYGESDTTTPGATYVAEINGDTHIDGTLTATAKSFLITHPLDPNKKLRYGSLEGPENGVYVRGRLTDNNKIELPDYWTNLVDENSITVELTSVGSNQKLFVKDTNIHEVTVGQHWLDRLFGKKIDCFYVVYAERNDVAKLVVEE